MFFRPCLSRREMESRRAPTSKEVRRPDTSTRETGPACRMMTEKFVGCTVHTLSAGEDILPVRQRPCAGNSQDKNGVDGTAIVGSRNSPHTVTGAGPRARSPVPGKDNSRDRRLWDEIAVPAPQDRRAAKPAAKQCPENNRSDRSLRFVAAVERAANNPRLATADGCARWPSIQ